MKFFHGSRLYRLIKDEHGQMLPLMSILLVVFLGTAALSVDLGRAYYSYRELQNSANAAALAGAEVLPASSAVAEATAYSSLTGDKNAQSNIASVTMVSGYPQLKCLTTLINWGMACSSPANANAIQVQQQAVVNLVFAPIFGKKTLTLTATSTAAMRGGATTPYNVAIVLDSTASMSDTDSDSQCSRTRLACALTGVQSFLMDLFPCTASAATCGTVTQTSGSSSAFGGGTVSNSVDRVALFTFPNVTMGTASDDYGCSGTNPTVPVYSFPSASASTYAPSGSSTATYEVTGYSSDYRMSDTSTGLSTTSYLSKAVGGGGSSCPPIGNPGGDGTYFAGAVYAAQASLVAELAANPGSQNVMIIISDGDASASVTKMASGYSATSGLYPSSVQQCAQAVTAAKAATAAGTKVYTIAYGAESSGCSTDTKPTITPCVTMEDMASTPQSFFSDYTQSGSSGTCISASQPTSNLNQIFSDIAADLTVARLIPNGTT